MKKHISLVAAAVLSWTPGAFAGDGGLGTADIFYSNLAYSLDPPDEDVRGDGAGARIWVGPTAGLFTIEYRYAEPDDTIDAVPYHYEASDFRSGLGWRVVRGRLGSAWLRGEWIHLYVNPEDGDGDDQDGCGIHTGGEIFAGPVGFHGEVGYLSTEDADGIEWRIGVAYQPSLLGIFAEYRRTDLDIDDTDVDVALDDIRAGLRVSF